jgi:hypothetical protein
VYLVGFGRCLSARTLDFVGEIMGTKKLNKLNKVECWLQLAATRKLDGWMAYVSVYRDWLCLACLWSLALRA